MSWDIPNDGGLCHWFCGLKSGPVSEENSSKHHIFSNFVDDSFGGVSISIHLLRFFMAVAPLHYSRRPPNPHQNFFRQPKRSKPYYLTSLIQRNPIENHGHSYSDDYKYNSLLINAKHHLREDEQGEDQIFLEHSDLQEISIKSQDNV